MRRLLLKSAVVLSAALALASAILWPVSYWRQLVLHHSRDNGYVTDFAVVESGSLKLVRQRLDAKQPSPTWVADTSTLGQFGVSSGNSRGLMTISPPVDVRLFPWFSSMDIHGGGITLPGNPPTSEDRFGIIIRTIQVPLWMLLLIFGGIATPGVLVWRRRRSRAKRIAQGLCATCGYDLRATPERCPECGSVPNERTTACATPSLRADLEPG